MSKSKILFLVNCILLITACALPSVTTAAPTPNIEQTVNAVRTESALTVMATEATQLSTSLIPATETLAPSMTTAPSHTVHPTLTITPTNTYVPTLTTTPTFTTTSTITQTATRTELPGGNPKIDIMGVERNTAVSVKTANFPPYQIFTIRLGQYNNYNNTKVVVGSLNSGTGEPIIFTSLIPNELKNVDKITIRLDSDRGYYAYNVFDNITSGAVFYTATPVVVYQCSVTTSPSAYTEFPLGADFDASWVIKNTGTGTWDKASVDYKHYSGTEMQKYDKAFDLPSTVDPDGTITLVVDMVAPNTAGTYTATWALVNGNTVLCSLPVTIKVK